MASHITSAVGQAQSSYQMESKDVERVTTGPAAEDEDLKHDLGAEQTQQGIKKIEAVTTLWSKKILWVTYAILWVVFFNKSLDAMTTAPLSAYATSSFKSHSLLPILTIITSMVSAVLAFPVAKLIDAFGRAEGFAFVALCSTLGSILSAACTGIDSYFGARVFKTIGNTGSDYVATVIISDMTALISRPFYLGLTALPYLATGFAGPAIADRLLQVSSWRWGYGIFSITTPVVSSFLLYFLFAKQREAQKFQVAAESPVPKGIKKQALYWFWEFDVIGLTLVAAGFVLLLLAVTLAKYNGSTWRSGHIIAMLILGPVFILAFLLWERAPATLNPKPMIPFHLLRDRTVLGVCTMGAVTRIAFYLWANYFTSYLQVVHGLSVTRAGHVNNVYSYVTCAWAPLLGLLFRHCCPYPKHVALAAIPVHLAGAGMMVKFRARESPLAGVVASQALLALGGGTLTNAEEIAIMAAAGEHQNVAVVLAFKAFFAYLGGAVGSAVSGAVWTNLLPRYLEEYLPGTERAQAKKIFASLKTQLSYEWGSPERTAIVKAYMDVQKVQTVAATVVVAVSTVFILIWRDLSLKERAQTKGRVL